NEIRFDDSKGREQLFLRAENAMDVRVGGNQHVSVGHERHLIVEADCLQEFKAAKKTKITGTDETTIASDQKLLVASNRQIHVVGPQSEKFDGLDTIAEKGINIKTGTKFHVETGGTLLLSSKHHSTDTYKYHVQGDTGWLSFSKLCLQCGASFIMLDNDGVTI